MTKERVQLGFGLGLRSDHYQDVLAQQPAVDWFEVISENYMVKGGKPLYYLDQIAERYPLVMHGVSLSLGGTDPLNKNYLKRLKTLAERIEPKWISDHLCWTGVNAHQVHDLLPLPYTEQSVAHVADRIKTVQDYLGRQILLENLSSYISYNDSCMSEWAFIRAIAEAADCLLLLDINNVYVSACNHDFRAMDYIEALPMERVWQIHLAGHSQDATGEILIDTHDQPVPDPVWALYREVIQKYGMISTMIERDDNIPPLEDLVGELDRARNLANSALSAAV